MHAQVAVGGLEHALEVVEAERIVGGERADDAEADALVNQAIEFGKLGSYGSMLADFVMSVGASLLASFLPNVVTNSGFVLRMLAVRWKRSSHRASWR